jgi:hypothetical protein
MILAFLAFSLNACGKPNISNECSMNGFGNGECSFSNRGTAEGAVTITVTVRNHQTGGTVSAKLDSGLVGKGDVRERKLVVPGVHDLCKPASHDNSWTDVCSFTTTEGAQL